MKIFEKSPGIIIEKLYRLILELLFTVSTPNIRIYIARKLGVKIGVGCRLSLCKFGSEPYLISIGNNCKITSGVRFYNLRWRNMDFQKK